MDGCSPSRPPPALAVGLLTGLVPAWRTPVGDVVRALRQGARGRAGDRSQSRLRNLFVTVEVAIALVLLVGAGLLVRSLAGVLSVERGFQTENRLFATISVPVVVRRREAGRRTNDELIRRLGGLSEIASVAAVSSRPLSQTAQDLGSWPPTSRILRTVGALGLMAHRHAGLLQDCRGCRCSPDAASPTGRHREALEGGDQQADRGPLWPGENPIGRRQSCGRVRTTFAVRSSVSSATCASAGSTANLR